MSRAIVLFAGALIAIQGRAQTTHLPDSIRVLDPIIVQAYSSDRSINEVPAAIGYLDTKKLERFSNTSLLPAVNTIPGVRMEERSPGSYRFAIRGSSLRSPFGVRNVKVYWKGLPLTDGGGNTYLNILDLNAIGSVEIIKGPGSSLYGAGTGGVVLLNSPVVSENQVQFAATGGSYGLQRYVLGGQAASAKAKVRIQYAHQVADGYRQQSKMRRDAFNADASFALGPKSILSATLLYTDLYYQTPGALTLTEYNSQPKQARPDTKTSPGSVTQHASIYDRTLFSGWTYDREWNEHWSHRTGIYASRTDFINPAIRNYEERTETNWGGRTETHYKTGTDQWMAKLTFGGEFQYFHSPINDYGNRSGKKDTLQFADKLRSTQGILFLQAEIDLPANFFLTVGGSTTFLQYKFVRSSDLQPASQTRNFTPVVSPRAALLKKLSPNISVYGSFSKGFSTPSLAEVRPSSNNYNNTLSPESGTSYELGIRGMLFRERISVDVTGYYFRLNNTIVQRETSDGADYFVNSGRTSQPGLESGIGWSPRFLQRGFVSNAKIWSNYVYNPYRFHNYTVGTADYSGNKLTGVAQDIIVSGLDVVTKINVYANITFTHTGALPLNDANSISAKKYNLLGARCGYKLPLASTAIEVFGGIDNALNARYSLGNDLNAAGGRYFNAAALRNYYVGIRARFY